MIRTDDRIAQAKQELLKLRNWVDFWRAVAASLSVSYLCFDQGADVAKGLDTQIFLLQAAIFIIAVLVQSVRLGKEGVSFVAPVFFMLGLSFGLIGWTAALFACVAGFFLSRLLPSPGIFLFAFAVLEMGFGSLLPGGTFCWVLFAGALSMMPVLLSGLTKRPLVWLNKSQTKPM